jgi:hypothetical protein
VKSFLILSIVGGIVLYLLHAAYRVEEHLMRHLRHDKFDSTAGFGEVAPTNKWHSIITEDGVLEISIMEDSPEAGNKSNAFRSPAFGLTDVTSGTLDHQSLL